jgi:eukaryotic-like serine/threonine-protein kinase
MEKIKFSYILRLTITGLILSAITAAIVMKLTFYIGQITLPDFSGMPLEKAQRTAARMKIDLKIEDRVPSAIYAPEVIISQDIKPKAKIKQGRAVYVIVSTGSKKVIVPDISTMARAKAVVYLKNSDLNTGSEASIYSPIYKEETVISQSPPAGSEVIVNHNVNFLKSLGPQKTAYMMPDFSGRNISEAYRLLTKKNIFIKSLTVTDDENAESGSVTSQSPAPGARITQESELSFTISKKPSDLSLKKRLIKIYYTFEGRDDNAAKLIRINVFSLNGSETVYTDMTEPGKAIGVSAAVIGDAIVQVFLGTELLKEMTYKAGDK